MIERLGVVGGGAWGTALAQVAAAGGEETLLWAREPEVVAASWCGKPVDLGELKRRFVGTPAGLAGRIHEIPSADILQPGARLARGAKALKAIFENAAARETPEG